MKHTFHTPTILENHSRIPRRPNDGATIDLERLNESIASTFPGGYSQHKSDRDLMNKFILSYAQIMAKHFPWNRFYHLDGDYSGRHSSRGFRIHLKLVYHKMFPKGNPT